MEVKKNKKVDLEAKRSMFFQVGMVLSLGGVLAAFEWSSTQGEVGELLAGNEVIVEEVVPPITMTKEITPPPPPPPPQALDVLEIVDDNSVIEDELVIESESLEDLEVNVEDYLVDEEVNDDPVPFFVLEDKPEFPGGETGLMTYISKNVKYPIVCQENGVQGKVYVSFVIDEQGKVSNVRSLRSPDANLEREALRVIKSLPDWKPGMQRGKPVKVSFQVPVSFRLQ
ncbi:energy transducer TonB [Marinilabiliaceae bacterium JC017]|nr:energy transducer TonB [Marinilabiliaceae bacterium JC017]